MESSENCVCRHRKYRKLLISMLIVLLVSSLTKARFTAEGNDHPRRSLPGLQSLLFITGRRIPKLVIEAAQEERSAKKKWGRIGSRPPNCEKRCSACGHCEAIQVPIAPIRVQRLRRSPLILSYASATDTTTTIAYSRDGFSNYKPMCWKCKCGDFIFNP